LIFGVRVIQGSVLYKGASYTPENTVIITADLVRIKWNLIPTQLASRSLWNLMILSLMNPVHILTSILFPPTYSKVSLPFKFFQPNLVCIYHLPCSLRVWLVTFTSTQIKAAVASVCSVQNLRQRRMDGKGKAVPLHAMEAFGGEEV
jgi:hypothetical protein